MIDPRGRPSIPGPARANTTSPELVLVSTKEKQEMERGNLDLNGDLVEPKGYVICGWRTNHEDEEATRVLVDTADEAGRTLTRLLRDGHVMFVASRLTDDGLVAYPSLA